MSERERFTEYKWMSSNIIFTMRKSDTDEQMKVWKITIDQQCQMSPHQQLDPKESIQGKIFPWSSPWINSLGPPSNTTLFPTLIHWVFHSACNHFYTWIKSSSPKENARNLSHPIFCDLDLHPPPLTTATPAPQDSQFQARPLIQVGNINQSDIKTSMRIFSILSRINHT